MNYINYIENNNYYYVVPDYVETNKENFNYINYDYQMGGVGSTKSEILLNPENNKVNFLGIVEKKYMDNKENFKSILSLNQPMPDQGINFKSYTQSNSSMYSTHHSTDENVSMKKESVTKESPKNINKKKSLNEKYASQIPQDYLIDIWESYIQEEAAFGSNQDFMRNQRDINEKMRAILIDWLVEVHHRFNLKAETLFLTVNLIDRYVSKKEILRTQLQLIGVVALFIACKYEEILCPDLKDFVYITDRTYTKQDILSTERDMLSALNFDICAPSSLRVFEIIALNFNFSEVEFNYGKYLLESFLIDPRCNKYLSSVTACAVSYIIMKTNNYSNYQDVYKLLTINNKLIKDCAKDVYYFTFNQDNQQFKAVFKKFSTSEFSKVAVNGMNNGGL